MTRDDLRVRSLADRDVLLLGAGVSGPSAVRLLNLLGARVTVADGREDALATVRELGATGCDPEDVTGRIGGFELVVTSPGWRPDAPVFRAAAEAGVPVWGDVELCALADAAGVCGPPRRWLAVTGTNGKTTTTSMLEAMLLAGGVAARACGNIGLPIAEAMLAEPRVDVLACELSSFQLHWAPSLVPDAGVVLNIAEDHLDWHGSMDAYTAAKARVVAEGVGVGILGVDDAEAASLASRAGADRIVGFRSGEPAAGELGVVDGVLVDRAFSDGAELLPADEVRPPGPAGIQDALAAAALALTVGVPHARIADALRAFRVGAHRAEPVLEADGVRWVDDSKATNPHAARTSLLAAESVVWIAGGQLKGAEVEDLVVEVAGRLRGAVLLGVDAPVLAAALARHAPGVPVVTVPTVDDGREAGSGPVDADRVMAEAVDVARGMARAGDTVLLAPAAASLDMFAGYGARGEAFASAARRSVGAE